MAINFNNIRRAAFRAREQNVLPSNLEDFRHVWLFEVFKKYLLMWGLRGAGTEDLVCQRGACYPLGQEVSKGYDRWCKMLCASIQFSIDTGSNWFSLWKVVEGEIYNAGIGNNYNSGKLYGHTFIKCNRLPPTSSCKVIIPITYFNSDVGSLAGWVMSTLVLSYT